MKTDANEQRRTAILFLHRYLAAYGRDHNQHFIAIRTIIIGRITYIVLVQTLNHAQSINHHKEN